MSGVEIDRRANDKKILHHIVEVFVGKQSRKVALGVWLLVISTSLLKTALITADLWMKCVYLVCGLVGFGTIMDDVLMKLGDKIATAAAAKINAAVETNPIPAATVPVAVPGV